MSSSWPAQSAVSDYESRAGLTPFLTSHIILKIHPHPLQSGVLPVSLKDGILSNICQQARGDYMELIRINLPEQLLSQLKDAASKIGMSPEDFIKSGIEEKLSLLDRDFQSAVDRVLEKNAELYKRLA